MNIHEYQAKAILREFGAPGRRRRRRADAPTTRARRREKAARPASMW